MKRLLLVTVLILGFNINAQIVSHSEDNKPDEVISVNMGTTKISKYGDIYILDMPDVNFTKITVRWSYVFKKSEMIEIYNEVAKKMNSSEFKKGESFEYKNYKGDLITVRYDKMMGTKYIQFVGFIPVQKTVGNESGLATHLSGSITLSNLKKLFSIEE